MTTPHLLQRLLHRIGYATRGTTGTTGDAGFTLIETVVSFALFAIVATSATAALINATKSSNETRDRVTAANLAQQDLQQARAVADRTTVAARPSKTMSVGTKTFTVKRNVDNTCPAVSTGTGVTKIKVTSVVTWPGSPAAGVTIATVLAC